MKLIKAKVKKFRSIEDSNEFEIGSLTCLVGKNEAGKTAVLQSLYGLKPFKEYSFDKTRDYPRRYLTKYDQDNQDGESEVIRTCWELDQSDIDKVNSKFVENILDSNEIQVTAGVGYSGTRWVVSINEELFINHLLTKHRLDAPERAQVKNNKTTRKYKK